MLLCQTFLLAPVFVNTLLAVLQYTFALVLQAKNAGVLEG